MQNGYEESQSSVQTRSEGGKNSSEYYKFPEISELKLYMGVTLLSPYFTYIDTGALMKNAVLFKDEGVTENTSLSLCLSGKGSGTYEGYHAMGSGKHEFSNGTATLYCANGTGLVIDKGIECKLGGYTTQTGLQSGVDMYGLSSLYYVEDPDSFDFSFFITAVEFIAEFLSIYFSAPL